MRRAVRRERRGQVDADESAVGCLSARHVGWRHPLGRRAARRIRRARHGAGGHRDHPPGADARARAVGGREHLPRQRDHAAGRAHALRRDGPARRGTAARIADRLDQCRAAGHELRRRPPAVDRDREGVEQGREAADPRRAVVVAERRRNAHPARHRARPEAARRRVRVHLAQARRGRGRLRYGHRDPRRPSCRDRADARADHRPDHRNDGRPRDPRPVSARAARDRRGRAGSAQRDLSRRDERAPQAGRRRVVQRAARRDPRRRRAWARAAPS